MLDQFFELKVSQGSVETPLRCGGISSEHCITQSITAVCFAGVSCFDAG